MTTPKTTDWRNLPVRPPRTPLDFVPPPIETERLVPRVTVDPRDAAIDDLRTQLAESRERAERAEARNRALEARLHAIREAVK